MSKPTKKTYERLLRGIILEISRSPVDTSKSRRDLLDKKMKKIIAKLQWMK